MLVREKKPESSEKTLAKSVAPPTHPDHFVNRHIGPDAEEARAMLEELGFDSMEDFMEAVVPESIRSSQPLSLPEALSEYAALNHLSKIAAENKVHRSYLGMGLSLIHI